MRTSHCEGGFLKMVMIITMMMVIVATIISIQDHPGDGNNPSSIYGSSLMEIIEKEFRLKKKDGDNFSSI